MTASWKYFLCSQAPSLEGWLVETLLFARAEKPPLVSRLEPRTCSLDIPSKKVKRQYCVMLNRLKTYNCASHALLMCLQRIAASGSGPAGIHPSTCWLQGGIKTLKLTNLVTYGIEEPWSHVILRVSSHNLNKNNKFLLEM